MYFSQSYLTLPIVLGPNMFKIMHWTTVTCWPRAVAMATYKTLPHSCMVHVIHKAYWSQRCHSWPAVLSSCLNIKLLWVISVTGFLTVHERKFKVVSRSSQGHDVCALAPCTLVPKALPNTLHHAEFEVNVSLISGSGRISIGNHKCRPSYWDKFEFSRSLTLTAVTMVMESVKNLTCGRNDILRCQPFQRYHM